MMHQRNIICFAPYGWGWKAHGSCKRFMNILSRENRVLYINNIQFVMPRIREIGTGAFLRRLKRKLKSTVKPFFKVGRSLYVFTPFLFPHYGSSWKKNFNEVLLQWQVRSLQRLLRMSNPIVWVENPVGITAAKALNPDLILYYRIDKFESHSELRDPEEIIRLDERLSREADLVLCVSHRLYEEKLRQRKEEVYYLPHGVDFDHFYAAVTKALPLPYDLKNIKPPIVGYFGTLDAKNDDSIIHYCASQRPDLSFVLIGEMGGRNELLEGLPNVHFLGHKAYEELPAYGSAFDACVMFWKVDDWIQHCHPVKTMEYLAMGKPVISIAFDEVVKGYDGLVSVARNREEFLERIEEQIANDSHERRQERIDFVRNQTWEARMEAISSLAEGIIRRRKA